ncbi:hypothetical protein V8E53_012699 [Lactarius tabidus]
MATRLHCGSELWITYHQASRKHKQTTAQLIDVGERSQLFDLEDVLDHVFQQDFVDPKWRSVVRWEDCGGARLKASDTVHDLLARGAGSTPASALRLIIADTPTALWVHYEYTRCGRSPHTATQRVRLDLPHVKLECLGHVTNYIFAQGYLPCKVRTLVSWKNACGKHIEESEKVEDLLCRGEGTREDKPLRLLVDL